MCNVRWCELRESYLRASGRTAELIREGFVQGGFQIVKGGGRRFANRESHRKLIIIERAAIKNLDEQEGRR